MSKPEKLSEAIEAAIYNALTGEFAGNTGGSLGGWTMELHEYERQEVARVLLWELKPIIAAELAAKDAEIAEWKAAAESEAALVNELNAQVEQAEAENEKKDAEIARLREECEGYVAEMARLNFQAIAYREALKPFADRYRKWLDDSGLDDPVDAFEFRRAAKALGEDR